MQGASKVVWNQEARDKFRCWEGNGRGNEKHRVLKAAEDVFKRERAKGGGSVAREKRF